MPLVMRPTERFTEQQNVRGTSIGEGNSLLVAVRSGSERSSPMAVTVCW